MQCKTGYMKSYGTLAVSDDLNTFHRTSFYLCLILFSVLAVVLTLCHLNHIRFELNYADMLCNKALALIC